MVQKEKTAMELNLLISINYLNPAKVTCINDKKIMY